VPDIRVPHHLQLNVDTDGETAVVRFAGELDVSCEEAVEATLRAAERRERAVLLDLSALDFIDSRGLRILIAARDRSEQDGFRLAIVLGDGLVRRAFEVTGLDQVLPVVSRKSRAASAHAMAA